MFWQWFTQLPGYWPRNNNQVKTAPQQPITAAYLDQLHRESEAHAVKLGRNLSVEEC